MRSPDGALPGPGISVRGLVLRYGRSPALDGIAFDAPPAAITVVLGPNGAGKTSLLRVLATLARPSAGEVRVAGFDLARAPGPARRRIGVVGHRSLLHADLTAAENLRYYARLYGLAEAGRRGEAALQAAALWPWRERRVRGFSRGMVQRLAIARALLHAPAVLLLDEPHTGLDPAAAEGLDGLLRAWAQGGATVLLTTHDLERAAALADRLLILDQGRITWQGGGPAGSVEALRERYRSATGAPPGLGEDQGADSDAPRRPSAALAPDREPGAAGIGGERQAAEAAQAVPPAHAAQAAQAVQAAHEAQAAHAAPAARPAERAGALPVPPAPGFVAAVGALVWKDLLIELRARELVLPVFVFALLVVVVFQFTLPRSPEGGLIGAPGALWVALLFGSSLGLARSMGVEIEGGGMQGLLLAPIDRGVLFVGKWLGGYLFSLLVAACLLPIFVVWLGLPPGRLPVLFGILALGLVGWVAAGTLMAAVAAGTRASEVLLPLLLFPVVLPLVIAAVRATGLALEPADPMAAGLGPLLLLVAAADLIFWVLGFLLLPVAVEG